MLQKLQKRNDSQGFTIIEVLIVLAIAGLILLIVFLAVPALQRNARNTGRKNDVANILGAMSEYTNNNGGAFPVPCGVGAGAGGCNNAVTGTFLKNAKLGTIDMNKVSYQVSAANTQHAAPPLDGVDLYSNDVCMSATTDGAGNSTSRSLVAVYLVETGGGTVAQCSQSGS